MQVPVIIILIIVFLAVSFDKRKKTGASGSGEATNQTHAARASAQITRGGAVRAARAAQGEKREVPEAVSRVMESAAVLETLLKNAPAAMAQGASASDDEGCLGGSMPHRHTEGESRTEHGRHVAAMKARDAEQAEPARVSAFDAGSLDAAQMRRAVVMAEVLGKPRALRARR